MNIPGVTEPPPLPTVIVGSNRCNASRPENVSVFDGCLRRHCEDPRQWDVQAW
jgi:hypothetical protein